MKTDIFSLGVIMFALVLGRLPFEYATKDDKNYSLIVGEKYEEFWKQH
jgi:serine/threonine protein kinase